MTDNEQIEGEIQQANDLVEQIRLLFIGLPPDIVGAALSELAAIFIAGIHPERRDLARAVLIKGMDLLIPMILEEVIEGGEVPPEWRGITKQ